MHRKPVEHCRGAKYYKQLLDPAWAPGRRGARVVRKVPLQALDPNEAWDDPLPLPEPARQQQRRKRARMAPLADHESVESDGSSDDGSSSRDSSGFSSSETSSSSSSSVSSTSQSSLPPAPPPAAPPQVKEDKKQALLAGPRATDTRIPFGVIGFLTPRHRAGSVIGFQMSCKMDGHDKCTKEFSVAKAGSETSCSRMLKTWQLWGVTAPDRESHRELWKTVEIDQSQNALMPHEWLDEQVQLWGSAADGAMTAPRSIAITGPCDPGSGASSGSGGDGFLGRPDGAPVALHNRLEQLTAEGKWPRTTASDRAASRAKAPDIVACPAEFEEACSWGYIGPTLAPPPGFVWMWASGWHLGEKTENRATTRLS